MGLDEDALQALPSTTELYSLTCDVLWCKKVTNFNEFQKAVIISLRAFAISMNYKNYPQKHYIKSDRFLPQMYKVLANTEDEDLAYLIITLMSARMNHPRF